MTTLKEAASLYQPDVLLNIADLPHVPVDVQVFTEKGKKQDGTEYTYFYTTFNDKRYRIPNVVLEKIQEIVRLKPTIKTVKVTKTGNGITTKYKVEVID